MIAHTPLDPGQLSTAAQRALGPGPGRMMAARGMMPLAPLDQLSVLYQLSLDADVPTATAARATAIGLPEKLLAGTLSDPTIDQRILDFFGQQSIDKATVFDTVVLNPSAADPTIAMLAARAGAREIDLIAQNEQRLLRHPEIIAAMYMNRKARMSTIDRVVELAVRNGVRVPGLAAWDEVAKALTGVMPSGPADDAKFDAVLGIDEASELTTGDADEAPPDEQDISRPSTMLELQVTRPTANPARLPVLYTRMLVGSAELANARVAGVPARWIQLELDQSEAAVNLTVIATGEKIRLGINQSAQVDDARVHFREVPFRDLPVHHKIRAATIGNASVRNEAVRDPMKLVAMSAIKSPGVTEIEAAVYARNQNLSEDVVRYIAGKREWTKMYGVKVSLCRNPKAPIGETTKLLPFLRAKDLEKLVKSKGIPSAVVALARKLQTTRGGQKK